MRCRTMDSAPFTEASFYAHDWAATALGALDQWDDALRLWVRFIHAAQEPMTLSWGQGNVVLFNAPFAALLGTEAHRLLGKPLTEVLAANWTALESFAADVIARRAATLREVSLRTWASGHRVSRYFDLSNVPLVGNDGVPLGSLGMIQDRTDEVMQRRSIARERDRMREVFEQAPGFIAMLEGPEHRYVLSNAANRRLLGREDVIGRIVAEACPELVDQGVVAILDRVYATGEPFIASDFPFKIQHNPGEPLTTHYVDTVYQPLRDSDGNVVGIWAEGYDITLHHAARERIQALQTELIHLSRVSAMDTMGSALAHELNQPLTAISNYIAAARRLSIRTGSADADLFECISSAARETQRAGDIIRKLREMTVKGRATKTEIDLGPTVAEAVKFALAGHLEATVDYDISSVETIFVDSVQFQQVLINLIRNSCDAASQAGVPCRILLSAVRRRHEVEFCVTDQGPGIDPQILPAMFESFISAQRGGMGIGLSICRTIIEAHGGRIEARNNESGGATICFTIPAR